MALLAFNLTGAAVTLAAGNPVRDIPASAAPPARGAAVNVTSELRGLTGANYTALQAQVTAGTLQFEWTAEPEYDVTNLVIYGAQTLAGAGAISVVTNTSLLGTAAAGVVQTLANGAFVGQRKSLIVTALATPGTDTIVVTPALGGPWTLACIGDQLDLEWAAAGWFIVSDKRQGLVADTTDVAAATACGTSVKLAHADHAHVVPANYFTTARLGSMFATGAKLTHFTGTPMINTLLLAAGGVAAVVGDHVEIGADTYEFRADATPPVGGSDGHIWVSCGASAADSQANLILAINGTGGPLTTNTVARGAGGAGVPGTNTVMVYARAGSAANTIDIVSAGRLGADLTPVLDTDIVASATAHATTRSVISTGTDVWNAATMYGGRAEAVQSVAYSTVTITADMVLKGHCEVTFTFTPTFAVVTCSGYPPFTSAVTIVGNTVHLNLGVHPVLAAADVVNILAFGA